MDQGSGLYSIRISGNIYPPIKGKREEGRESSIGRMRTSFSSLAIDPSSVGADIFLSFFLLQSYGIHRGKEGGRKEGYRYRCQMCSAPAAAECVLTGPEKKTSRHSISWPEIYVYIWNRKKILLRNRGKSDYLGVARLIEFGAVNVLAAIRGGRRSCTHDSGIFLYRENPCQEKKRVPTRKKWM